MSAIQDLQAKLSSLLHDLEATRTNLQGVLGVQNGVSAQTATMDGLLAELAGAVAEQKPYPELAALVQKITAAEALVKHYSDETVEYITAALALY